MALRHGSSVSVTVANLVMEDVAFWKRFADDVCTSPSIDKIQHFLSHINSTETTIKFTAEVENENRISFLDADIMHHSDGS